MPHYALPKGRHRRLRLMPSLLSVPPLVCPMMGVVVAMLIGLGGPSQCAAASATVAKDPQRAHSRIPRTFESGIRGEIARHFSAIEAAKSLPAGPARDYSVRELTQRGHRAALARKHQVLEGDVKELEGSVVERARHAASVAGLNVSGETILHADRTYRSAWRRLGNGNVDRLVESLASIARAHDISADVLVGALHAYWAGAQEVQRVEPNAKMFGSLLTTLGTFREVTLAEVSPAEDVLATAQRIAYANIALEHGLQNHHDLADARAALAAEIRGLVGEQRFAKLREWAGDAWHVLPKLGHWLVGDVADREATCAVFSEAAGVSPGEVGGFFQACLQRLKVDATPGAFARLDLDRLGIVRPESKSDTTFPTPELGGEASPGSQPADGDDPTDEKPARKVRKTKKPKPFDNESFDYGALMAAYGERLQAEDDPVAKQRSGVSKQRYDDAIADLMLKHNMDHERQIRRRTGNLANLARWLAAKYGVPEEVRAIRTAGKNLVRFLHRARTCRATELDALVGSYTGQFKVGADVLHTIIRKFNRELIVLTNASEPTAGLHVETTRDDDITAIDAVEPSPNAGSSVERNDAGDPSPEGSAVVVGGESEAANAEVGLSEPVRDVPNQIGVKGGDVRREVDVSAHDSSTEPHVVDSRPNGGVNVRPIHVESTPPRTVASQPVVTDPPIEDRDRVDRDSPAPLQVPDSESRQGGVSHAEAEQPMAADNKTDHVDRWSDGRPMEYGADGKLIVTAGDFERSTSSDPLATKTFDMRQHAEMWGANLEAATTRTLVAARPGQLKRRLQAVRELGVPAGNVEIVAPHDVDRSRQDLAELGADDTWVAQIRPDQVVGTSLKEHLMGQTEPYHVAWLAGESKALFGAVGHLALADQAVVVAELPEDASAGDARGNLSEGDVKLERWLARHAGLERLVTRNARPLALQPTSVDKARPGVDEMLLTAIGRERLPARVVETLAEFMPQILEGAGVDAEFTPQAAVLMPLVASSAGQLGVKARHRLQLKLGRELERAFLAELLGESFFRTVERYRLFGASSGTPHVTMTLAQRPRDEVELQPDHRKLLDAALHEQIRHVLAQGDELLFTGFDGSGTSYQALKKKAGKSPVKQTLRFAGFIHKGGDTIGEPVPLDELRKDIQRVGSLVNESIVEEADYFKNNQAEDLAPVQ